MGGIFHPIVQIAVEFYWSYSVVKDVGIAQLFGPRLMIPISKIIIRLHKLRLIKINTRPTYFKT